MDNLSALDLPCCFDVGRGIDGGLEHPVPGVAVPALASPERPGYRLRYGLLTNALLNERYLYG